MSFTVSWIYKAVDKYTPVSNRIARANEKMTRSFLKSRTAIGKLGTRLKKLNINLRTVGKSMMRVGRNAMLFVSAPLAFLGVSMIKAASDAVETANKYNQVFSDVSAAKRNKVAADFAKNFGVALSTAQRMISGTGDLLVGFELAEETALDFALGVAELSSDLASFQNFEGGAEGAALAITKALLGETESAKALGIVIRQLSPEYIAMVDESMRAEHISLLHAKALAAMNIAAKQSRKAIGDVSRTWDDYASVQRRAEQAVISMKEEFGKPMLPGATKIALMIETFGATVRAMSPEMKKWIVIIGGIITIIPALILLVGSLVFVFGLISWPITLAILGVMALAAALVYVWHLLTRLFLKMANPIFDYFFPDMASDIGGLSASIGFDKPSDLTAALQGSKSSIDIGLSDPAGMVASLSASSDRSNINLPRGPNLASA